MRTLYLLAAIYIALILTGCTTESSPAGYKPSPSDPRKDPIKISFLSHESTDRPYQVVGLANVSKFNPHGIKRQEATLRDLMREQAAEMNGDAIIDVKNDDKTITATVIAYKESIA